METYGEGLTLALRAPSQLVTQLLDLAQAATDAEWAALYLIEDDATLRCHFLRERGGRAAEPIGGLVPVDGLVREVLSAPEPRVIPSTEPAPDLWGSLAPRSSVLAPLSTPDGPLGLLVLGWDRRTPAATAQGAVSTATQSLATVLDAAIEAHVERSRAVVRERVLDEGREPIGRALAAIYLRAGILRLVLSEDLAGDAAEIEALARHGLAALRQSEETLDEGGRLSDELFEIVVDLTDD